MEFGVSYTNKDGVEKKLDMPGKVIPILKDHLWKLEDVKSTNGEKNIKLLDEIYLKSHQYKGGRWITFTQKDPENWKNNTSVTIPQEDFDTVILRLDYIMGKLGMEDLPLRRNIFPSMEITGDQCFSFNVKIKLEDGFIKGSHKLHLTQELAEKEGREMLNEVWEMGLSGVTQIKKSPIQPIDEIDMMECVYLYHLIPLLDSKALQNCEGCFVDLPGQKEHMGVGGCLTSLQDKLLYFNIVKCDITPFNLSLDFNKLRAKLGMERVRESMILGKFTKEYFTKEKALTRIESSWFKRGRGAQMMEVLKSEQ